MTTLVALGTGVRLDYSTFVTLWPAQAEQLGLRCTSTTRPLIIVALVLAGSGWRLARRRHRRGRHSPRRLAPKTARVVL
jgi:Cu+-exporting ATPase